MDYDEYKEFVKKLAKETKILAQPIDFEELERKGILIKDGAWYKVPNIKKLPEHVSKKISEIEIEQDSKGITKEIRVKLYKSQEFEKFAHNFNKLSKKIT